MSAFDNAAMPGKIPTSGSGASMVTPAALFKNEAEKALYESILNGGKSSLADSFKIKKVKVEIFDMSDETQRHKYEKLWAELLVKVSKREAVVEASKDLVKRPDGTSYWMKYVEYVEFGESGSAKKTGGKK